ncbi:hypothetical protein BCR33DRAFT_712118 [Rhizoclosmatium globosum]|uniref:Uncharacterized protein n=1 Tax=Rhizoclosmatium globosum TaxID=329046 RepID=A0A1Y2CZY3_9FUNG|nr:hypothetical protein BCR33DRAFT_712118 [Rhizoclosmatium globosum]|eukprot:ORY51915.1 hypothetical protein BCR33DRAFT_712118 [Rhizoclosmatium globosum]
MTRLSKSQQQRRNASPFCKASSNANLAISRSSNKSQPESNSNNMQQKYVDHDERSHNDHIAKHSTNGLKRPCTRQWKERGVVRTVPTLIQLALVIEEVGYILL